MSVTIVSSGREERHLVMSDYHYANVLHKHWGQDGEVHEQMETVHDSAAMKAVETFMEIWKPTKIWYNGDMVDTHQVSVYSKEPHQIDGLADDIKGWADTMALHQQLVPGVEQEYNLGNHEFRWEKWLREHAKPIRWMDGLAWSQMVRADELGIKVNDYGYRAEITDGLIVTHGELTGPKAGDSARKYLEKYAASGITGHVHKLIIQPKPVWKRTLYWAEGGCLCDLKPYYTVDPDWTQGITLVTLNTATGNWKMEQAQIKDGVLTYGGTGYSG